MKEILMEWIINIAIFSLISTLVMKLLPGKTYIPYVKLFAGMVTILLFLNPILALFGMDEKIADGVSKKLYDIEMDQMETELIQIEEEQKERLEEQYKKMIEEQE